MYTTHTVPQVGMQMPNVSLVAPDGKTIHTGDYRHRCNLVVAFVAQPDADARRWLLQLAARYADFDFEDAEILAVVHASAPEAARLQAEHDLPFPVLVDAAGEAHRAIGAWDSSAQPAVYVLNRYGRIYAIYRATARDPLPDAEELLGWLRFVGLQCPECGVSEWAPA